MIRETKRRLWPMIAAACLAALTHVSCENASAPKDAGYEVTNPRPIMAPLPHTTYQVGEQKDVTLRTADADDYEHLTYEIEGATLPDLASRSQLISQGGRDGIGYALFRFTPEAADVGDHEIKFRVRDLHGGSAATRLRLTVVAP